jgi:MFS family permease
MRALWNLIIDFFYTVWLGVEYLAGIAAPRARQYLRILFWLAVAAICLPVIPALIGLVSWQWLVAIAGLIWGFLALLLFILAAPLGILINVLLGALGLQPTNQRAGRRYVLYTGSILLFGMFFALMVALLPWRNNPIVVPFLLLGAAILAVSGAIFGTAGILGRKVVITITSFILVIGIISLFFPKSFAELNSAKNKADAFLADTISGRIVSSGANFPVCAETERAIIVTLNNPRVEVPVYPDCFSGWISIQSEKKVNFRLYKQPEKGFLEIVFVDGSRRLIHENEREWLGHIPRLEFRIRGTQGKMILSVEPIE